MGRTNGFAMNPILVGTLMTGSAPHAQDSGDPAARQDPGNAFGFRFVAPLALGATLNPINTTMIATALVPIATDLRVSAAEAGLLVSGLYMASAVAQPTMGRLADVFGPRRIYLGALALVALAGLLGPFTPSLAPLVGVRVLLGIGTSAAYPAAMRILRMQADRTGSQPPRVALSVLSLASYATTAVGFLLGGVLTGAFGWRSIFVINVPMAALAALLVILWVPRDEVEKQASGLADKLDFVGLGLFAAFMLGLLYFLMNLHAPVWWAGGATVLFGTLFWRHASRRKEPFIDVKMLTQNVPLTVTFVRAFAIAVVVTCVIYGLSQWLETGRGLSSTRTGLVMLPFSLVAVFSALAGGRTKGIRVPFILSVASQFAGCICLLFIGDGTPVWVIASMVMLFGLPQGMFSTATQTAVYVQAPKEQIGAASGLQRAFQYFGAIIGTSLLGFFFDQHATTGSLHSVALVTAAVSELLLVAIVFDRTLPRSKV